MGKGTDKLYITHSEWSGEVGTHTAAGSGARAKSNASTFSRLPYDCCALSLKPFETPVATAKGTIYELTNIIPYLRKHGTDPVSGEKLSTGDLIKLNFSKNNNGDYHDPLTFKPFTQHTPIVFIKTSGNVYSKDAIDQLNIKPGFWKDLISDEPFTRADIITIQDPHNLELRDFSQFEHLKNPKKSVPTEKSNDEQSNDSKQKPDSKAVSKQQHQEVKSKPAPAEHYKSTSTGATAASMTSTTMSINTKSEREVMAEEDYMFKQVSQRGEKAYVRLVTSLGQLNVEIYADRVPKTSYNFISLAKQHYYDDTIFHRLIPGFMVQGGDPTGTGRGGSSMWGKAFADEFGVRNAPKHTERGTLSMANHGKDTNGSQFFITFKPTPHLDNKHTVFGHVVGGEDTLDKIEKAQVDKQTDRPIRPLKLIDVAIFKNPFEEHEKREARRRERQSKSVTTTKSSSSSSKNTDRTTWFGTKVTENANKDDELSHKAASASIESAMKPQIGKYIQNTKKRKDPQQDSLSQQPDFPKQDAAKKSRNGQFGDFSSW